MKQKTIQEQYILLKEGKIAQVDFLKSAKRQFPGLILNNASLKDTETILKSHKVLNEGYIDLKPIGTFEGRKEENFEIAFKNFLKEQKEEIKADTDKVSKYVEDAYNKNYGIGEKNNPNKISFQQFIDGVYSESYNPKNVEKTLEEIIEIVQKNLDKDFQYYLKNYYKGVEGYGLEQIEDSKEPKGKHASSGYGDLDKDTKSLIKENAIKKSKRVGLNQGLMKLITEGLGDGDVKRKTYELDITSIESFKKMLAQYFPDKFEYDLDYYINWFNKEIRPNLNEDNDEEDGSFVDNKLLRDIDNKVKLINSLIEKAYDSDGDPIAVVDSSGTWEEPIVYEPLSWDGEKLILKSKSTQSNIVDEEVIEGDNLYHDGIPSLNYIGRMYRKALKKHNIQEAGTYDDLRNQYKEDKEDEGYWDDMDDEDDDWDYFKQGKSRKDNPYEPGTSDHELWNINWEAGEEKSEDNIDWDKEDLFESQKESGLIVKVDSQDINSFENWLDQSPFYAEKEGDGVYFFEEAPENFDNLEKFLQIEMAAEDISVQFEAQGSINEEEKFIPHVQLHENKNMNLQQKLKEIEKTGITAALEAKMSAIQEEINTRQEKISSISENEALADFVDKSQIKNIEKEIKELEKHKVKLENALAKANGGKKPKKQVVDEDEEIANDERVEESDYAYDDERYWEEKDDEAYAAAYDAMDDETLATDFDDLGPSSEDYESLDSQDSRWSEYNEDDKWADDNSFRGGDHDFKNHPINEGYTTDDKIDFLSQIRFPEPKDMLEFGNLDKLSPKTIQALFESYFPQKANKKIIKG